MEPLLGRPFGFVGGTPLPFDSICFFHFIRRFLVRVWVVREKIEETVSQLCSLCSNARVTDFYLVPVSVILSTNFSRLDSVCIEEELPLSTKKCGE